MPPGLCLVCFAVKEEAAPFQERARNRPGLKVLITGMGNRNAEAGLRAALALARPVQVFTCGFAGALHPDLRSGQVVADGLEALGFPGDSPPVPKARFHCADRVIHSAREKRELRAATGADAVEMESGAIHKSCAAAAIPCATVRVILDTADEDLPLDFNALLNSHQEVDPVKLAGTLLRNPGKVPELMRFQKRVKQCAEVLAETLVRVVEGP